ncbi:hypothetical protein NIES2119_28295 [[Phormidium ambiguum] IAM M-71]|uniref:SpoVT-AbrB domain-containing protein n=1 Tax=[Phormidium ambiguum] IAM M-71 TaxID=454136 RepID=A0A1U7I5R7_9CYAN|nr:hypothetical protein [Phormidium ambiguum]OKH31630.1 hypothetical protein NIES2119_28295 [Phormidium ambiguum IAM M-71]
MQAVEFQAIVKEGKIQIPDEYKQELQDDEQVKVIVLINNKQQQNWKIMDKLSKNPISVKGLTKLTRDEIHDRSL